MPRYGSEFYGGRREWGRGYGGEYGFRGGTGRRNRYGTFEPAWREAAYRAGYRGREEGWGRGARYGAEFYGRRPGGARGYPGGPGRGGFARERGRGGAGGFPSAGRDGGYGAGRGLPGGRRRGATGEWRYGGEYGASRTRPHGYGADFGDRLEHGWNEFKRGVRHVFGREGYGREYRRRG